MNEGLFGSQARPGMGGYVRMGDDAVPTVMTAPGPVVASTPMPTSTKVLIAGAVALVWWKFFR